MQSDQELLHALALQRTPNLGAISIKKLITTVGSAEAVYQERTSHLIKIDGIGSNTIKHLKKSDALQQAEVELQFIEKEDIQCLYFLGSEYPDGLRHCVDGPVVLFQKGNIDLKRKKLLSIVGTRRATLNGKAFLDQLLKALLPFQPVIISGFAYGIDIYAQRTANQLNLQTVGCLAHGLNQWYPKAHQTFVPSILSHGGFLTEFWSDDPFERTNFLKRNRIIAGLSEATVVIESAEKGGSLVTADLANSYNREVLAVPGRPTDVQSKGCNNLIKSNSAHLLSTPNDLIELLGWDSESDSMKSQTKLQLELPLEQDERNIIEVLNGVNSLHFDELLQQCKLASFQLAAALLTLEMKGWIQPLPGKRFRRV